MNTGDFVIVRSSQGSAFDGLRGFVREIRGEHVMAEISGWIGDPFTSPGQQWQNFPPLPFAESELVLSCATCHRPLANHDQCGEPRRW